MCHFEISPSFVDRVYAVVRRVPRGCVISYGAIAHVLGRPRAARQVGWAMAAAPSGAGRRRVPAHRVINARGELSAAKAFGGYGVLRARLEAEGITFLQDGRVDLERHLWLPSIRSTRTKKASPEAGEASLLNQPKLTEK